MDNKLHTFLTWVAFMKLTLSQWLHAEQLNFSFLLADIAVFVMTQVLFTPATLIA